MNKKISKILMTITTFFMMTQNVFGNTLQDVFLYDIKDSDKPIFRYYDGNLADKQFSITIGPERDNVDVGYCIDVGKELKDQHPIYQLEIDLKDYLKDILNSESKAAEVATKINEYVHFGYNYNGQTGDKYLVATQKLIWDKLYEEGYSGNGYSAKVTFSSENGPYNVSSEETKIENNITNFYKTPSLCSSNTNLELAVGETATYEDTSNVLSSYKVNCDEGLTCKIDGNKLTITANSEASEQKVTFTKPGIDGNGTIIYRLAEDQQAVLVGNDPIKGVSCQLGVDTYQNVQTSETKIIVTFTLAIISVITAYAILLKNQKLNA